MVSGNRELRLASLAVLLITTVYIGGVLVLGSIPAASDMLGHSLGILGFLLMLVTETLYSLRKRSRSARWGTMASWLQFHIFTGIVGPYLVLLHSSWRFKGLAGLLTLLTLLIVISGFIGRYIYTAVPRTLNGVEIEAEILHREILNTDDQLKQLLAQQNQLSSINLIQDTLQPSVQESPRLIFARAFDDFRIRRQWRSQSLRAPESIRSQIALLESLHTRRRDLNRQVVSLALARQMLALWHTIHIPIGMALFTISIIHIIAAIYYATLP